jgi:hypothetical protein
MRSFTSYAAPFLCAALAVTATATYADQTYSTGTLQFERKDHPQWGAPGDKGTLDITYSTERQEGSLNIGPLVDVDPTDGEDLWGAGLNLSLAGSVGVNFQMYGKNGTASVKYPLSIVLNYPDPRTLRPGDTFTIQSSFVRDGNGSLRTTAPDWGFKMAGVADFQANASFIARFPPFDIDESAHFFSINGGTDSNGNTLDKHLRLGLFDTDMPGFKELVFVTNGKFELFDQVVRGNFDFPQVITSGGNAAGNTLTSSGGANFLSVDFSITNALMKIAGLPSINREDFFIGANFEEAAIAYSFHLLDLYINTQFSLQQNFTFVPKPQGFLQLSTGEVVPFTVGQDVTLTMPVAPAGSAANNLTITPTFTLDSSTLTNVSKAKFAAGLYFDPLSARLKVKLEIPVLPDIEFDESFRPLGGPYELIGGDVEVPLMEKTFTMKGFNTKTISPFVVEGFQYGVPTIGGVSPSMIKRPASVPLTITVEGTNFVDSYTNAAGTIPGSQVCWNGQPLPTTYVSATQLKAELSAAQVSADGSFSVTVKNPEPGGGASNAVAVVVDGTGPIISASPNPALLYQNKTGNPNILNTVTVSGTISDPLAGVDPVTAKFSVVDEYGQIQPSGSITVNQDGSYSFQVRLSPTRDGKDRDGRVYTITVTASDKLGNPGSTTTTVLVPRG